MKKFVLKKSPNETLIASLEIETLFSKNAIEAFSVVNAWVRDITNGEMFLLLAEGGYYVSTFKKNLNFKVVQKKDTIEVYKIEKPSFYIKEVKE